MKNRCTRAVCLLLALCVLSSCGAKADAPTVDVASASPTAASAASPTSAPKATPAPTATPSPTPEPTPMKEKPFPRHDHDDVHYDDMRWELYDMTDFNLRADALAASGTAAEAIEHYDWLMNEYARLSTYATLAMIEFYASGGKDQALAQSRQQLEDSLVDAGDKLYAAVSKALAGGAAKGFSAYLGEDLTEKMSGYETISDRERELLSRETELTLRYNELVVRTDIGITALNRMLGEILLEMVRIRNELAEINGYETYAQYAYENTFGRDFTPEDAAALSEAIKPYARAYFRDNYYCSAFGRPLRDFSAGELMDLLREYAPRISPKAAEAQRYMEDHGLYIIESAAVISSVGFTTVLPMYNAPILYDALIGTYDVTRVFHEFGHYCDAYWNPAPDLISESGSFDVFEIHSTSMEVLMLTWYDEIFGEEADRARIFTLDRLLSDTVTGCLFDEFQQYVYAHPDMTVDELNQAYYDIASSYGVKLYTRSARYSWMYVNHTFEYPFYYISYAVSTLASLQVLSLSERDMNAAIELYNRLIELGAYEKSYKEVLTGVGM